MSEPNDVVYQCQGDREFLVRIYQPDGPGPFPTVVDVHGGAWHIGDRRQNAVMHVAMAAAGILVAALDFRQSHDAPYPASILDINLGVRWVKANAHRFNGTLRVGGLGSSSGGHQILLTALRPYDERYTPLPLHDGPDVDASLAFVVACCQYRTHWCAIGERASLVWTVLTPMRRTGPARPRWSRATRS